MNRDQNQSIVDYTALMRGIADVAALALMRLGFSPADVADLQGESEKRLEEVR